MKFNLISSLLLLAGTTLAHSNECSDEVSKYKACVDIVNDTLLNSTKAADIKTMCEKFKDDNCKSFLTNINTTTSQCKVSDVDEKSNALSILNRRIAYLKYCATDSKGTTCPISEHLLEDIEEEEGHSHSHAEECKHVSTFKNEEVQKRTLSDFEGEWKSAYPILLKGELDSAFAEKSKDGKKTAEEYKEYYKKGYATDIAKITIKGDNVSFTYDDGKTVSSDYENLGPFIIDWSSGTRAALYQFVAKDKKAGAPIYIEFNDHGIEPCKAEHFHIRVSNESFESIDAENSWPTFFPANLDSSAIGDEISGKAHSHSNEDGHDHEHEHAHSHSEEDHEHAFYHELMEDCEISECNQRYINLVELLKLTGNAEAKDFEEYISYYQKKDCAAIHALATSGSSSTMKMTYSFIAMILFSLIYLI